MMQEADPNGEVGSKKISYATFKRIVGVGHPSCLDSAHQHNTNICLSCWTPYILTWHHTGKLCLMALRIFSGVFDYIDRRISEDGDSNGFIEVHDLKRAFAFLGFDVRSPLVSDRGQHANGCEHAVLSASC